MIIANNVTKKYEDKYILKNFNYIFEKGVYLICGKSGKGKTTLLNVLSLFDNECEGKVIVDGDIFYLRDFNNLVGELTVKEHFELFEKVNENKIEDIFNLENILNKKVKKLSLGERQLVSITLALNHPSQNILLDEPFSALSKENVVRVCCFIGKLVGNKVIIISSHSEIPLKDVKKIDLEKVSKRRMGVCLIDYTSLQKKRLKMEYLNIYYKKVLIRKILFVCSLISIFISFVLFNRELNNSFDNYLTDFDNEGVIISQKNNVGEFNERIFYEVVKRIAIYVEDYNVNYYNSKLYNRDIKAAGYYIDNGFIFSSVKYIERNMREDEIVLGLNYKRFCLNNGIGYCDREYVNALLINKEIAGFSYYINSIFESEETVLLSNKRFVKFYEENECEEYYFDIKKTFLENAFEIINRDEFLSNFDFILIGENEEYYRYEVRLSESRYFNDITYENYLVCLEGGYNCFNYLNHFPSLVKIDEHEIVDEIDLKVIKEKLNINEIVISSDLSQMLSKERNDIVVFYFKYGGNVKPIELHIKEVINESGLYVCQNSGWSYSFFKEALAYKESDLRVKNIVVYGDIKNGDFLSDNIYEASIKEFEEYTDKIKNSFRCISIVMLVGSFIIIVVLEVFQNKFKKDYFRYLKILNVKIKKEP